MVSYIVWCGDSKITAPDHRFSIFIKLLVQHALVVAEGREHTGRHLPQQVGDSEPLGIRLEHAIATVDYIFDDGVGLNDGDRRIPGDQIVIGEHLGHGDADLGDGFNVKLRQCAESGSFHLVFVSAGCSSGELLDQVAGIAEFAVHPVRLGGDSGSFIVGKQEARITPLDGAAPIVTSADEVALFADRAGIFSRLGMHHGAVPLDFQDAGLNIARRLVRIRQQIAQIDDALVHLGISRFERADRPVEQGDLGLDEGESAESTRLIAFGGCHKGISHGLAPPMQSGLA